MISSIQAHRPLDGLTTFGTRSEADHYAEAGSLDELEAHLAEANANGLPVHFLGAGANTIAMSRVPGMTIRITIKGVEMSAAPNGDVLVKCGAGEVFDDIVARTLKAGIGGLENLSAIPGTVGGAVVQNIGAYGVELAERLSSVTVYDRAEKVVRVLTVEECDFSYRHSIMKTEAGRNFVVLSVTLRLPAAWLIEAAGFKGLAEGPAGVYEHHALIIVNRGGATGEDVMALAERIQKRVFELFGVKLEMEPVRLG